MLSSANTLQQIDENARNVGSKNAFMFASTAKKNEHRASVANIDTNFCLKVMETICDYGYIMDVVIIALNTLTILMLT